MTTLTAAGHGNLYDFTASVFGYGLASPQPLTGTASLVEVSTNSNLGTISLPAGTSSFFVTQQAYQTGVGPFGVATADFKATADLMP